MRLILTVLYIISITMLVSQSNCDYENLFPIELGLIKFNVIITISTLENYSVDEKANKGSFDRWETYDKKTGLRVFKSYFNYKFDNHKCYKGSDNVLNLYFVDDRLYKMFMITKFSNTELEKCQNNYNVLVEICKHKFPDWGKSAILNTKTKEQIGTCHYFYPEPSEINGNKVEHLNIIMEIIYEEKINKYSKTWYKTGKIDGYSIIVENVNLNGTKLTGEGGY